MEIHVLNREMARKHVPDKPELLIGILDSKPSANVCVEVIPSSLRLDYLAYRFDDVDEAFEDYVLMDNKTAERILTDFSRFRSRIESLAVHCTAGLGRSPACCSCFK
ncbi:MAG: hypothetical protein NT076_03205 [Candidatus Pacearchaeota archaeon]|nr:hypothetical protein [Candidatus Pacearchaeota archaeon]